MTAFLPARERGATLLVALVMLLIMTVLAVSSMRGVVLESRITANRAYRKRRARHYVKPNFASMARHTYATSLSRTKAIAKRTMYCKRTAQTVPAC